MSGDIEAGDRSESESSRSIKFRLLRGRRWGLEPGEESKLLGLGFSGVRNGLSEDGTDE